MMLDWARGTGNTVAKNWEDRVASYAACSIFIAIACALSGCGPTTASLVPSDVRATLAADARANAPKLTAEDILAKALGKEQGGETIVAKTNTATSSSPDNEDAQTIIAKTSTVDTLTTAGVSTHSKTPVTNDDEPSNPQLVEDLSLIHI